MGIWAPNNIPLDMGRINNQYRQEHVDYQCQYVHSVLCWFRGKGDHLPRSDMWDVVRIMRYRCGCLKGSELLEKLE